MPPPNMPPPPPPKLGQKARNSMPGTPINAHQKGRFSKMLKPRRTNSMNDMYSTSGYMFYFCNMQHFAFFLFRLQID